METTEARPAPDIHTRDQRYAARIYEQIQSVPQEQQEDYGAMAQKLPVLVRTAGLAQALAYVEARGKDADHRLLDDLAATTIGPGRDKLLARSHTAPLYEYLQLTRQVLAALAWYKRFAQAVFEAGGRGQEG